jgi:hypothetical protein
MQINGTITQPTCGESNGAVTVTVEGGTAPYTYAWNIQSNMPNIIGLDAGLYSVIVKDAQL